MLYREPKGLGEQIDRLRTRWPQAHYEPPKSGSKWDWHLILLPRVLLPKGWNKTICTALFLARFYEPSTATALDGFYVDLPDLRLENGAMPHYARPFALNGQQKVWHEPTQRYWGDSERLPGFPQWRELTRFWWRAQAHNPNYDTLFTSAMLVRQRMGLLQ